MHDESTFTGQTGSGKGVSSIMPGLPTARQGFVVLDPQGELFLSRRSAKSPPANGDAINPLEFIDADSPEYLAKCRAVAEMLLSRSQEDIEPYWQAKAEELAGFFMDLAAKGQPSTP